MLRILAGRFRGRVLKVAPSGTRPTSARVRGAIFDVLAHAPQFGVVFDGLSVADLYAGSGAMGLEAVSRGADRALFVDASPGALRAIHANARILGVEDAIRMVPARLPAAAARLTGPFDLVFVDPPYVRWTDGLQCAMALGRAGALARGAIVVVELPARAHVPQTVEGLRLVADRTWGDTRAVFLQPDAEESEEP